MVVDGCAQFLLNQEGYPTEVLVQVVTSQKSSPIRAHPNLLTALAFPGILCDGMLNGTS